jgi:hypothetical protein
MRASVGTVPAPGTVVRVDPRATDDVPPGARLQVNGTRSSTVGGWCYLDVAVLDDPGRTTSILVPVASITAYSAGQP